MRKKNEIDAGHLLLDRKLYRASAGYDVHLDGTVKIR
jgi:hypothetical protein